MNHTHSLRGMYHSILLLIHLDDDRSISREISTSNREKRVIQNPARVRAKRKAMADAVIRRMRMRQRRRSVVMMRGGRRRCEARETHGQMEERIWRRRRSRSDGGVMVGGRRRKEIGVGVCAAGGGGTEMQRSGGTSGGATATVRKQTIQKGDLSQAPKLDDGDGGGFGNFGGDDGDGGDGDGDGDGDWGEYAGKGSALGFLIVAALMAYYYRTEKEYRKKAGLSLAAESWKWPVQYDDPMDIDSLVSYSR